MNIALVGICYNSYGHLESLFNSLAAAYARLPSIKFTFVIVDNSTQHLQPAPDYSQAAFPVHYIKSENVGYFPGFQIGLEALGPRSTYDAIIISNVDLIVSDDFFKNLSQQLSEADSRTGMLAPSIICPSRGGDLNPKVMVRPTRRWLKKNIFIFRHIALFRLYRWLSDLKIAKKKSQAPAGTQLYSPHGSFMIFTSAYLESAARLDYNQFLFGEEDFVAEECRLNGLTVRYRPEIVIHDSDHGSTSKEALSFIAREHVKSLNYILKTYHGDSEKV
ncbi:glycosyltransferase family 2 protein [Pseudomonas sp. KNUC1026]|uniref:glycosyltransferase family 2 protein n=1 Tax=Pseudomonas sp. KNUC1026 TaxID=2893890 RepID=UPI001F37134B|nr:glycosyltransferase [Pseudomonas sp. KNUC1026]UFH48240.1 glycosyltransferase [Pseudomonas sp. KNUC1026]